LEVIESFIKFFPKELKDWEKILSRNRIWVKRNKDVGVLSKEDIYFYGLTGAVARGSGVFYDIRKLEPYDAYGMVEFDVPLGENGDCYDRYLVRIEEMKQSIRIIEQCVQKAKNHVTKRAFYGRISRP
jgi:NADH:ubiquinone oxidoreductase 49 kD subunit 7